MNLTQQNRLTIQELDPDAYSAMLALEGYPTSYREGIAETLASAE